MKILVGPLYEVRAEAPTLLALLGFARVAWVSPTDKRNLLQTWIDGKIQVRILDEKQQVAEVPRSLLLAVRRWPKEHLLLLSGEAPTPDQVRAHEVAERMRRLGIDQAVVIALGIRPSGRSYFKGGEAFVVSLGENGETRGLECGTYELFQFGRLQQE